MQHWHHVVCGATWKFFFFSRPESSSHSARLKHEMTSNISWRRGIFYKVGYASYTKLPKQDVCVSSAPLLCNIMLPHKVFLQRILYGHYVFGYFVIKSRSPVWQYFFGISLGSTGCCVACHPLSLSSFFYLFIFLQVHSKSLFGWRFCLFKSSLHWIIGHSGVLHLSTLYFKFHEITFILNWCKIKKKSDWRCSFFSTYLWYYLYLSQ